MIGVCISTTPDRLDLFRHCWDVWEKFMPENAILTYVNDVDGAGVARVKNASLKVLENLGVTDYFLVDNDTVPVSKDWYKPYIESGENHLMYLFDLNHKQPLLEEYRDDKIVAYSKTRGCFLYATQKVLDTVGGMDIRYGIGGYEHTDWTNRIHNAGLTTYRSMDVPNSSKLLYCLDQDNKIKSSIDPKVMKRNMIMNGKLYQQSKTSKEYMEYK